MSVRNELSDFEIEEFCGSLKELLVSFINNEYLFFDSAEFMSRRFDGYERTLNVLTLRILTYLTGTYTSSYHCTLTPV